MLYWPTDGSDIRWDFPNLTGLTEDTLPDVLFLEVRNDVGLWYIEGDIGGPWVTPGYLTYGWTPGEVENYPPEGEYTYELTGWDTDEQGNWVNPRPLGTGLMIIGDYKAERTEVHEMDGIEYMQYGEDIN